MRGIHVIFDTCISSRSKTEDDRRHEFILNIILFFTILVGIAFEIFLVTKIAIKGSAYRGLPSLFFLLFIATFVVLLVMSRKGYFRNAAYVLVGLYYSISTYCAYIWGIELPLAGFGYVVTIVVSSILVSTRFGFFITAGIATTLLAIGWLQTEGIVLARIYWKSEAIGMNDPLQLSLVLLLIMTVSWLSNREIERSLRRARKSERELLYERDMLEIKVEERTRELKEMQMEKISNLYRFAEFGKLSSGLFHDLMNPLTAVVTNISELERSPQHLPEVKNYLDKAVHASRRIGEYLGIIRKQIRSEESEQAFSMNKELEEAVDILQYRAREMGVTLKLKHRQEIITFGHAIKFYQVALNLLSNAIDSYEHCGKQNCIVTSVIAQKGAYAVIMIADKGMGIPAENLDKIFDPFFSTKSAARGMGLGLSSTKNIIEKHFNGTISVTSTEETGSVFTVRIPIHLPTI